MLRRNILTSSQTAIPELALASLSVPVFMSSLDTSIANAGLPALALAFGASFPAVQWIVLAYLLALTSLIVSVGRLGDQFGRRRLLLAGIALFTAASLACGAAPTLGVLVAARAVQGVGAATMLALSVALVGETVAGDATGRAMGLLGTMSAAGTALGPSLGGLLIVTLGWRSIFLVNVPVGVVSLWLAHRFLPADTAAPARVAGGFDVPGTLLLALTLSAYALAMTSGHGVPLAVTLVLLAAALAGAVLFVLAEARSSAPLVRLAMFREPRLRASLAMSALVSTVIMSTLVVGPFYLSGGLGLGAARVGLLLSVGPLVVALTGMPAGRWVDHIGAPRMTRTGLMAMTAGSVLLALAQVRFGTAGYLGPIAVMTAGYALFQTANNTAVMTGVSAHQRGVVSGMLSLSRNLGLITGASWMGAVFALASGANRIAAAGAEAVAAGMRATFALAALLMVVALAVAIRQERGR